MQWRINHWECWKYIPHTGMIDVQTNTLLSYCSFSCIFLLFFSFSSVCFLLLFVFSNIFDLIFDLI